MCDRDSLAIRFQRVPIFQPSPFWHRRGPGDAGPGSAAAGRGGGHPAAARGVGGKGGAAYVQSAPDGRTGEAERLSRDNAPIRAISTTGIGEATTSYFTSRSIHVSAQGEGRVKECQCPVRHDKDGRGRAVAPAPPHRPTFALKKIQQEKARLGPHHCPTACYPQRNVEKETGPDN